MSLSHDRGIILLKGFEMNYKFEYNIMNKAERLYIFLDEKRLFEKSYTDCSCLIDLIFYQKVIPIDDKIRDYVSGFLNLYVEYYKTKDFSIISDSLIKASIYKVNIGYIPKDSLINMSLRTDDIEILVNFIILQIYTNDIYIKKHKDSNTFYLPQKFGDD